MMRDANMLILLIEDNQDHAELIIDALREHHLENEIVWLDTGEDGIDFLFRRGRFTDDPRTLRPILILLDIKLPGIDGIEVLKTIKLNPQTTDFPVVMLTTSREESEIMKSYSYHASSYIVKPLNFKDFIEVMRNLNIYWSLAVLPKRQA
jgi:two-component system, response regulator